MFKPQHFLRSAVLCIEVEFGQGAQLNLSKKTTEISLLEGLLQILASGPSPGLVRPCANLDLPWKSSPGNVLEGDRLYQRGARIAGVEELPPRAVV
jgi:hypothetical protein